MSNVDKWRREADRLLATPSARHRDLTTVIGRVEDRFDGVLAARRLGMSWRAIAKAMEHGDTVSIAAAESAFKRLCRERNITPPARKIPEHAAPLKPRRSGVKAKAGDQPALFSAQPERWVDNGD